MAKKFKKYIKISAIEMRPYIPGESLRGIAVNQDDKLEKGGMIARSAQDHRDMWYVSKGYFKKNYALII